MSSRAALIKKFMFKKFFSGRTLRRIAFEADLYEILQIRRKVVWDQRHLIGKADFHDGRDGIVKIVLRPRGLRSGHLQDGAAEGPDVRLAPLLGLPDYFGGHPRNAAPDCLGEVLLVYRGVGLLHLHGAAEIG